jgi:RimJ/RimL family protein N-acetyltransferase
VPLLLRFYFDELRYQKVNAGVYAFNEASLKLHAKLGMREEGRIRRAYFSGGEYHDELRFGMTAEEFRELLKATVP